MVKVSIIVPIYNVEQYLTRCIDSLINQTLQNIEIILVNDASPDHSDYIMNQYQKKYSNVKCIYLESNRKQGGARNAGIRIAEGEYLLFVDSDDWVSKDYCEKLYQCAVSTSSDVVYSDYVRAYEEYEKNMIFSLVCNQEMGVLDPTKRKLILLENITPAWGKLIRTDFFIKNNLYFSENTFYEDVSVIPLLGIYAEKVSKIEDSYYYYYCREKSIVSEGIISSDRMECEQAVLLLSKLESDGTLEQYREEILYRFIIYSYIEPIKRCFQNYEKPPIELLNYLRDNIRRYYPEYRSNPYFSSIEPKIQQMMLLNDASPEILVKCMENPKMFSETYNYVSYYLERGVKIGELFRHIKGEHKTITVWGMGQKGKDFLKALEILRCNADFITDVDRTKWNCEIVSGKQIRKWEEIENDTDVILVMNRNYYTDIKNKIRENKKAVLFNMDMFFLENEIEIHKWMETL